jgi:hypothetical protein
MYRDLPRGVASGFYAVEREGEQPFAWTGRSAAVRFSGMRRSDPWECTVRFRGGRADVSTLPDVEVAVDGLAAGRRASTNEYQDLVVRAEPRRTRRRAHADDHQLERRHAGPQRSTGARRPGQRHRMPPCGGRLGTAAGRIAVGRVGSRGDAWGGDRVGCRPDRVEPAAGAVPSCRPGRPALDRACPVRRLRRAHGVVRGAVSIVAIGLLTFSGARSRAHARAATWLASVPPARFVILFSAAVFYLKVSDCCIPAR